jgi:hypothetical protein
MIEPIHEVPKCTMRWRYGHWPNTFRVGRDAQFETQTANSVFGAVLRLIAGYERKKGTVSRTWDSFIRLDSVSLGIAHFAVGNQHKLLHEIATRHPALAQWAWGKDAGAKMADMGWLRRHVPADRGRFPCGPKELEWLAAGWYAIGRQPAVCQMQARIIHKIDVLPALRAMNDHGWKSNRMLAGLARLANSSPRRMDKWADQAAELHDDETESLKWIYTARYAKPDRLAKIMSWPELDGDCDFESLEHAPELAIAETKRPDGTKPPSPEADSHEPITIRRDHCVSIDVEAMVDLSDEASRRQISVEELLAEIIERSSKRQPMTLLERMRTLWKRNESS